MKKITLLLSLMITSLGFSQTLTGTWKLSPQAAAFGVGPAQGNTSWYANNIQDITDRACQFDDEYVFNADGSFSNVNGANTWIEGWQVAGVNACGASVAPHNGSNPATWVYNATANTITLTGVGAYLGLPKAYNGGELSSPSAAPASITYKVTSFTSDLLTLDIEINGGAYWRFVLAKQVPVAPTPTGTWKLSPQAVAFGVGPAQGNTSWYANNVQDITDRACQFDDQYVFNADGSFSNVNGANTWIEGWQVAGVNACGASVAPHNGSNPATWVYNATANTITLTGVGAYLGLPKAYNGGELSSPSAAPASITYKVTSITSDLLTLDIEINGGAYWRFVLAKQTLGVSSFETPKVSMYPNPTSGIVNIEAGSVIDSITVYNVLGQEMISQKGNSASETLNISNLQSGIYIVKTTINGKTASSRIIKE